MERVELSLHTKMSQMSGVSSIEEYIHKAKDIGMKSLAITDYEVVQAFPVAQRCIERINDESFKIIYGMEANFCPTDDIKNQSFSINILIQNQTGLKNLYKIISCSYLDYFYEKPIVTKKLLDENRNGILIGSGSEKGELYQIIFDNKSDEEIERVATYYDYLEVQPVENLEYLLKDGLVKDLELIKNANKKILAIGDKLNKLVVATGNVHFLNKEDEIYRRVLQDKEQSPLFLRTTEEMMMEFEYFGKEKAYEIVVENTNKISDMCEKISPLSLEKCYIHLENENERIRQIAYEGLHRIFGEDKIPKQYEERLKKELALIIENNYANYYLIYYDLVRKVKEDGCIVGFRGSIGSSLVAYCLEITEVDPIKYNLPFEVFAGLDGKIEPDIYLNVAKEYKIIAQEHLKDILKGATIYRCGTVVSTFNSAYKLTEKYFGDRHIEITEEEEVKISEKLTGIKSKDGYHPGAVLVVPEGREIFEFTPIQHPSIEINSRIVSTHFDYHDIDKNLLKINILENKDITILQRLEKITNKSIKKISLDDEKTWNLISSGKLEGISEFDNAITLDCNPTTIEELIRISALIHGTGIWKENADELVETGIVSLKDVISTRDDIMNYLIDKGLEKDIAYNIMETVRKGKINRRKEEKWDEYKSIMIEHDVPNWYIESCEKIQYLFPRAHAVAYVINCFRLAFFKAHYPEEFERVYSEVTSDEECLQ